MLIRSNESRNTCIYKGYRFERQSILDVRTHFRPTESFQYTEFPPVTLWASGKASLKVKLKDFLELTLQRKRLKITLGNSNESYERGVIQITFQRRFFQKLNSAKDHRRYKINKTHKRILLCVTEYCPLKVNDKTKGSMGVVFGLSILFTNTQQ